MNIKVITPVALLSTWLLTGCVAVIVGAGVVGYNLADYLSKHGHNISIIEKSSDLCETITGKLDVFTVNANASNPQALESAGIRKADMIIAVTPHDDTNLVVCNFAMQFDVPQRIARITAGSLDK